LGKDLVETLDNQGATVYALSRNPDNLAKLKSQFPSITTVRADLSNWDETRRAMEQCGPVDYLINNAGVIGVEPFMSVTPQHFDEYAIFNQNYIQHIMCLLHFCSFRINSKLCVCV
jgi:NADP-dependent 3-hydroxy acid dehydrogenase YdfG